MDWDSEKPGVLEMCMGSLTSLERTGHFSKQKLIIWSLGGSALSW